MGYVNRFQWIGRLTFAKLALITSPPEGGTAPIDRRGAGTQDAEHGLSIATASDLWT